MELGQSDHSATKSSWRVWVYTWHEIPKNGCKNDHFTYFEKKMSISMSTTRKQSTTHKTRCMGNIVLSRFCAALVDILHFVKMVSCEDGGWQIQHFEIQLLDITHAVFGISLLYAQTELGQFIDLRSLKLRENNSKITKHSEFVFWSQIIKGTSVTHGNVCPRLPTLCMI